MTNIAKEDREDRQTGRQRVSYTERERNIETKKQGDRDTVRKIAKEAGRHGERGIYT